MYRPIMALFVLALISLPTLALAEGKSCKTIETMKAEAAAISPDAVFATLDKDSEAMLLATLASAGVPEAPPHDLVAVVTWPTKTFTILLFKEGCIVAFKNGLPVALLGRDA
jgi:hypothetical protein